MNDIIAGQSLMLFFLLDLHHEESIIAIHKLSNFWRSSPARMVNLSSIKRNPKVLVAELFDSFANTFDEMHVGILQYQLPQLIGEAVQNVVHKESHGASFRAVLDARCVTGLAGRELRPMIQERDPSGVLVGVDASSKMLNICWQLHSNMWMWTGSSTL
jgi:predicted TPR repeat methyltransferase